MLYYKKCFLKKDYVEKDGLHYSCDKIATQKSTTRWGKALSWMSKLKHCKAIEADFELQPWTNFCITNSSAGTGSSGIKKDDTTQLDDVDILQTLKAIAWVYGVNKTTILSLSKYSQCTAVLKVA